VVTKISRYILQMVKTEVQLSALTKVNSTSEDNSVGQLSSHFLHPASMLHWAQSISAGRVITSFDIGSM
jgi:hypothetical protein